MYKHILVPIAFDQDHDPKRALAVARTLCAEGGRVTLVHVMAEVPFFAISYMPEGYGEELRAAILNELRGLARDVPGGSAEVLTGDAGRKILDLAEDAEADCIVIHSHRPGMAGTLVGSTASRVVRHAECSVHVLR